MSAIGGTKLESELSGLMILCDVKFLTCVIIQLKSDILRSDAIYRSETLDYKLTHIREKHFVKNLHT